MNKLLRRKIENFLRKHIWKYCKFLLGGLVSFLIIFSVTYFMTDILVINYLISYAVALFISIVVNFFMNTRFIFLVRDKTRARFIKYIISVVVFYFLNLGTMKIFVDIIGIHYLISVILVTAIFNVLKYVVYSKWIFNKND